MSRKNGKSKVQKDFIKKKRKVGKIGKSNDTLISIKTRKIVLPKQHTEKNEQILYKGKSLTDLLVGTRHTNSNHRTNNISNLHEMLSNNFNLITANIGRLLERVGILIQDTDEDVRASVIILTKLILNHVKCDDLPFLHIFITQISGGMLHIDKGVQKATVQVLLLLLRTHLSSAMKYVTCLVASLKTLFSTCKSKKTILLYLDVILSIFSFYSMPESCPITQATCCIAAKRSVKLYPHTVRRVEAKTPLDNTYVVSDLVQCMLPHIEAVWLEDAPSQVYVSAEPAALKTSISIVTLLKIFQTTNMKPNTLIRINSITKSIVGRYPFQCSVSGRDSSLLWKLNLAISDYLVNIDRSEKPESYFSSCFLSHDLTGAQISEALGVISQITSPSTSTVDVIRQCALSDTAHSNLFLVQYVQNYLHTMECNSDIVASLKGNISHVGCHIIRSFYNNRRQVKPEILALCTDKPVFEALGATDQVRCLELYYTLSTTAKTLAGLGQGASTHTVLNKFYSVLLALYIDNRITVPDFISVLLAQADKDDTEELDMTTISSQTEQLLENFLILPDHILHNLLPLTLPHITSRLYTGLSQFSLASYLLILQRFVSHRRARHDTEPLYCEATSITKISKIISSLIFNKESVSDWGQDIVVLSVRISLEFTEIFEYIAANLGTKPIDVLSWYFGVVLRTAPALCKERRDVVLKIQAFLCDKVTQDINKEFQYRLNLIVV